MKIIYCQDNIHVFSVKYSWSTSILYILDHFPTVINLTYTRTCITPAATSFGGMKWKGKLNCEICNFLASLRCSLLAGSCNFTVQSQRTWHVCWRSADSGSFSNWSTLLSEDGTMDPQGHRLVLPTSRTCQHPQKAFGCCYDLTL